jgi:iron complex transport system ATP-binding protein
VALQADDLVVLAGGQLRHHGPCGEPEAHRALEQVFDGRVRVRAVEGQWTVLPEIGN